MTYSPLEGSTSCYHHIGGYDSTYEFGGGTQISLYSTHQGLSGAGGTHVLNRGSEATSLATASPWGRSPEEQDKQD